LAPQLHCSCRIPYFVRINANLYHRTRPCEFINIISECRSYCLCEQKYVGGGGVGFFAKDTTETKKLNAELKTRRIRKAEDEKQEKIRAMEGIKRKRDLYVR
jgi:hypothetical protein